MTDDSTDPSIAAQPTSPRVLRRLVVSMAAMILVMALLMFLPAGSLRWWRGWAFLAVYTACAGAAVAYLWRVNREILVARSTFHRGTKAWDRLPFLAILLSFMAMFPVAALDDGRFHWSAMPLWLCLTGYLLLLVGMVLNVYVLRVNKFAEPTVRIQTERGHKVIDTGPYSIVRHPLYATSFFLLAGIPLALGSYWALVPAAVAALALVVRTALEDRMLQRELDGYREYTRRVRYRLIPGIW